MHLELMRIKQKDFPDIQNPESITSARIWHCNYTSLASLSKLKNLQTLSIATYPDTTFEPLAELQLLESLEIVHLPKIVSLSPLAHLKQLKKLSLSTLPSWDSSGKITVIESLEPLAELPLLEDVSLFGVVPKCKSVDELLKSTSLQKIRISKYPKSERQKVIQHVGA